MNTIAFFLATLEEYAKTIDNDLTKVQIPKLSFIII